MFNKICFCLIFMTVMSTYAPLMKQCGCLIRYAHADSNWSPIADCSNNPGFELDCLAKLQPESLDLSGNELEEVPAALTSSAFKNLKHLDLSRNKITRLASYNFGTRLRSLNISHNYLTDLFSEKPIKLSIDVSYNKLTDMRSIFGLVNTNATVRGNPILCKCSSPNVQFMLTILHSNKYDSDKTTERLKAIECILDDKDVPKPISAQCHYEIYEAETYADIDWQRVIIIIAIILSVFFIGMIINRCMNGNNIK